MTEKSESFRIRQEQLKKIREKYGNENKELPSNDKEEKYSEE